MLQKDIIDCVIQKMNLAVKAIALLPDSHSSTVRLLTLQNNEKVVLKIAYNKPKFLRETMALNLLKNKINCPELIDSLEDDENSFFAMLLSYIPSNAFADSLSKNNIYKLGENLAYIHQITFDFVGEIYLKNHSQQSWAEYFPKLVNNYCELSKDFLPAKIIDFAKNELTNKQHFINEKTKNVLCHFDFRIGNILANTENIYILDFENSRSAKNVMDFTRIERELKSINPDFVAAFREGYSLHAPLSAHHHAEVDFLNFYHALGAIGWCAKRNQTDSDFYRENLEILNTYMPQH